MWGSKVSASGSRRRRSSSLALVAFAAAALLSGGTGTRAAELFEIGLPQPLRALYQDAMGSFATVGEETFQLVPCDADAGICLQTLSNGTISQRVPSNVLPDGYIAIAEEGDIRNAWYGQPTERYAHGVLGDATEGGSLVVVTDEREKLEFVLPETQVFEDITPRIRDLDGDGRNEVIAIRSSQTGGAAVALYGIREGELVELGAGSENGSPNRWTNIAGIIGNDDGTATVYAVRTPHIGGRLFSLTFADGNVSESDTLATDVSNHVIGSRELGLSAVGDVNGDGRDDLVLLSQDRTRLRFPLSDLPDIAIPATIDKAVIVIDGRVVTGTTEGRLLVIMP
ncbi:hypothetical protein [Oricola thermophila]|uniref:VCBS repeat-containing protein n=1 Tax=Oricola thermophila TaxID=2742145 RepID=A0A6N1VDB0_9HYPH|nr:hypothetical protein [Oricola thermophila]QKV18896.1 hypothetical protein HTY61_10765 [Oricola thermophila]